MSAITARAIPDNRFSWPRVSALSGTMTVHLIAAALVLAPLTVAELQKPDDPPPSIVSVVTVAPKPPPPPPRVQLPPPTRPVAPQMRMPPVLARPFVPDAVLPIPAAPPPPVISPPTEAITPPVFVAPSAQISIAELYKPKYPRDALRQRHEGQVVLRVLVGIDGVPEDVQIEESSGSRSLDRAAREAVEKWIFNPGMQDGVAQRAVALVPIAFRLHEL